MSKILSFQHVIHMKILMRSFTFLFRTESSRSNVSFVPRAHLNSAWPHFESAVAANGCRVRCGTGLGHEEK